MNLAFLMMHGMGMQDPFDVLAFRSVFYFDSSMEEDVMDQEIPCTVHGDTDPKEQSYI